MRITLVALLLAAAAGCGHQQQADPRMAGVATGWWSQTQPQPKPVDVSRQTEPGAPGPTRGAPDGRR